MLLVTDKKATLWLMASTKTLVNPFLASLLESEELPSNLASGSSGHVFCLDLSKREYFAQAGCAKNARTMMFDK